MAFGDAVFVYSEILSYAFNSLLCFYREKKRNLPLTEFKRASKPMSRIDSAICSAAKWDLLETQI